jgi:hypothetical protein
MVTLVGEQNPCLEVGITPSWRPCIHTMHGYHTLLVTIGFLGQFWDFSKIIINFIRIMIGLDPKGKSITTPKIPSC